MARDPNLVSSFLFLASVLFCVTPINGNNRLLLLCPPDKVNYTSASPFRYNLEHLLDILASSTAKTGFSSNSAGNGPDQVFGQALCRHDVNRLDCGDCLGVAKKEIMSQCNSKDADIWYDYCQVSYSISNFSYSMNYLGKYPDSNNLEKDVSDPLEMSTALQKLMDGLRSEATLASSMFAADSLKFSSQENVYGLVQCTRGISGNDCSICLTSALQELRGCCSNQQGGIVLSRYCNVRFGLSSFYNLHSKGKLFGFFA